MSRAAPSLLISKLFKRNEVPVVEQQAEYPTEEKAAESAATPKGATEGAGGVTESSGSDTKSEVLQQGVKQAEAIAAAWTLQALVLAYAGYAKIDLRTHEPCIRFLTS